MNAAATDLLHLDADLSAEELETRDTVREFVDRRIRPNIAGWFADRHSRTKIIGWTLPKDGTPVMLRGMEAGG